MSGESANVNARAMARWLASRRLRVKLRSVNVVTIQRKAK